MADKLWAQKGGYGDSATFRAARGARKPRPREAGGRGPRAEAKPAERGAPITLDSLLADDAEEAESGAESSPSSAEAEGDPSAATGPTPDSDK